MRKHFFIVTSLLLVLQLFAEKNLGTDDFTFSVPNFVEEYEEGINIPRFNVEYRISNSIISEVFAQSNYYRSDAARSLIGQGRPVTQDDVLKKLNSNDIFVLIDDFRMSGILLETYRKIKVGETIIGEMVAYGAYEGAIYKERFLYQFSFVINNTVHNIILSVNVNEVNSLEELNFLDDILYMREDKLWFFYSLEDGKKFHELIITSNTSAPQLFLELNVALRWLLSTLKINNQNIEVVSPDKVFLSDIQERLGNYYIEDNKPYPYTNLVVGTINDDRLRVRTEPRTGETLGHVNTNDRVIILGRTGAVETIDNLTSYWYNIKFGQQEGWIFGGYVDVEQRDKDYIKISH